MYWARNMPLGWEEGGGRGDFLDLLDKHPVCLLIEVVFLMIEII